MDFNKIDLIMSQAVEDGVFPGGALMVSKKGNIVFNGVYGYANIFTKQPITHNTIFDLASLTKPLATTMAAMSLVQEKKIQLEQTIGSIIKEFQNTPKAEIQLRHLLRHNSGLPSYQPYFLKLAHLELRKRKSALKKMLIEEPLTSTIGAKTEYSDIGFMILEWGVEVIAQTTLDDYVSCAVYRPFDLKNLFFINLGNLLPDLEIAATEVCPWRRCLVQGVVHDENAHAMGGIAAHSGLFGSIESVHQLLTQLMSIYNGEIKHSLFKKELVHLFFDRPNNSNRALGFDTPSETDSSCGNLFQKDKTVGHLGFTGTSFWMDLYHSIIIILLTNRVHPSRKNEKIKKFRPILHNAIMNQIITSSSV